MHIIYIVYEVNKYRIIRYISKENDHLIHRKNKFKKI